MKLKIIAAILSVASFSVLAGASYDKNKDYSIGNEILKGYDKVFWFNVIDSKETGEKVMATMAGKKDEKYLAVDCISYNMETNCKERDMSKEEIEMALDMDKKGSVTERGPTEEAL